MSLFDKVRGWFGKSHVGAGAPGKPVKPAPYPKGKKTAGIATHGKVLRSAHTTLGTAQAKLQKATRALAQTPVHAPPKTHVGATALSPKVKAAQAKHAAAVAQANAASANLAKKLLAGRAVMTNLSRAMVAQKKLAVSMRRPRGSGPGSHIGHLALHPEMTLAETAEFIGSDGVYEFIGQDPNNPPDPNSPGFLMDGSPDPNAQASAGAPAALSDGSLGDQIDNGQVTFPAPPPIDVAYADMTVVGGIAYDGSKGYPDGFAGSLMLFNRGTDRNIAPMTTEIDGNEHHGYVFGQYDWKDPHLSGNGRDSGGANVQPGGGIPWGSSLKSGLWNWVHGRHEAGSEDWHTDVPNPAPMFASPFRPGNPGDANNMANEAYGQSFGPLVGNPAMRDFSHMRIDAAGNCFWLPQEAPDWLTFPLQQAAALTAKAAQDAQNAANAAAQAAIAKINSDAAVAQAQAAADAAAQQAQVDAATQAANVQTAQAQGAMSQTTAQQAATQAQQEQQAGDLLMQMAQQQMQQARPPMQASTADGAMDQETGVDEGGAPNDLGPEDTTPAEQAEQRGGSDDLMSNDFESPVPELDTEMPS